ncbi:MAG: lysophospholipid acyltransferase family protein [bacterium]|nr:lysophospholipid acyltransferase family protein [bacterium]
MVRLLNDGNIGRIADAICFVFSVQKLMTHIKNVNKPEGNNCIYAMWHSRQLCLYGLPQEEKLKTNIMISRSKDGEVIARAINKLFGFKAVRGSKGNKGAVEATMQMIELLKNGEYGAIMVDGPRGPLHEVKKGVIKIAKLSGVPIIPLTWYTKSCNLVKLPSWDKFEMPLGFIRLINLYGDPIYVSQDGTEEDDEKCRLKLQESLLELDRRAPEEFDKVYR